MWDSSVWDFLTRGYILCRSRYEGTKEEDVVAPYSFRPVSRPCSPRVSTISLSLRRDDARGDDGKREPVFRSTLDHAGIDPAGARMNGRYKIHFPAT